jgi:hypothetical protein
MLEYLGEVVFDHREWVESWLSREQIRPWAAKRKKGGTAR